MADYPIVRSRTDKIGEILDVTGQLGEYNFLWAWVMGHKVGQVVGHAFRKPL